MNFIRENVSNAIRRISGKEVPSPAIIKSISQEAGKNELAIRGDIFWYFDELELRDERLRNRQFLMLGVLMLLLLSIVRKSFLHKLCVLILKRVS